MIRATIRVVRAARPDAGDRDPAEVGQPRLVVLRRENADLAVGSGHGVAFERGARRAVGEHLGREVVTDERVRVAQLDQAGGVALLQAGRGRGGPRTRGLVVDRAALRSECGGGRLGVGRGRALLVSSARRQGEQGNEGEQGSHTAVYTAGTLLVPRSSSMTVASSSGDSPTTRWPAAGSTRSGQRRRRAYSNPSASGISRSRAPQTTAVGHVTPARSGRGSSCSSALAARFDVRVLRLGLEEADHRLRREEPWVVCAPVAEDRQAQVRPPGQQKTEAGDPPRRTHRRDGRQPDLRTPGRRDDPGGRDEDERGDRLGPLDGEPERDGTAHGVPDEGRRRHVLVLGDGPDVEREAGQALELGQWLGPAVAGQVGNQHTATPGKERGEVGEVPRRPTQAVHEDERRPRPADPVARPEPCDLLDLPLEPPKERCRGHPGNVSCEHGRRRSTKPLSFVAEKLSVRTVPARALPAGFFAP